ncbi:CHASE2 domain-containing protein [Lacibacterium aquatile]|uniref:CHASE2 domain-containing protein n=1 Tax=Lacibacterium aquatile TaxID=1168082 RepID=A0ABW5DM40_9PROT
MLRRWVLSILTLAVLWAALFGLVVIWRPPTLVATEGWASDLLLRLTDPVSTRTVIVGIDEEDLKELGQWPWSRDLSAKIVDRLIEGGASAVGLLVTYAEPDRLATPQNDTDGALVRALANRPTVVLTLRSLKGVREAPVASRLAVATSKTTNPEATLYPALPRVPNLPAIEQVTMVAPAFSYPDPDEVVRRVPAFLSMAEQAWPSMATALVARAKGCTTPGLTMWKSFGGAMAFCDDKFLRLGLLGTITLARPEGGRPVLSAAKVLAGEVPAEIRGRPVLFGALAVGLSDPVPVRDARIMPVELHARAVDTLLAERSIQSEQLNSLYAMIGVALLCLVRRNLLIFGVMVAAIIGTACYFATQDLLIEPVGMLIALLGAYLMPRWR